MRTNTKGSVTARVKGGLGNQLFQYAAGKAFANQLGSSFAIDTGFYLKAHSNRQFKLPELGICAKANDFTKKQRISKKLVSQLLPSIINGNTNYLSEPDDYAFQAFSGDSSQNIYLDGYWQSEKYFLEIRQELLAEIDLSQIEAPIDAVALPSENTVAVHVRRGDYIANKSSQVLSIDYLNRAMHEFGNNADFMFFSDDINWCKENIKGDNLAFANNQSDLQDLKQMSEAAHNVIANSTFSWWSAWLNKNENQRVVAPRPWTYKNTHKDILPAGWETIDLRIS